MGRNERIKNAADHALGDWPGERTRAERAIAHDAAENMIGEIVRAVDNDTADRIAEALDPEVSHCGNRT